MENREFNSTNASQNGKQSKEKSTKAPMQASQLMNLYDDELKDLYWAEKAVNKAKKRLMKNYQR